MPTVATLVRHELAVLRASRLARAGLVAVLLLPLLYGAMYLWAFWDPTHHLDRVPVALVNADRPVSADGRRVTAGQDLQDTLLARRTFAWHVTDAVDAAAGVSQGRYYLAVVMPEDFSADVASPADATSSTDARQATIDLVLDDANSYLASTLAGNVLAEVRSATSAKVATTDARALLDGLAQARTGLSDAAAGAGRLADGAASADTAAHQLAVGAGQLVPGAGQVSAGAGDVRSGASTLAAGTATVASGADRVAAGAATLQASTAALPTRTAQLASGAGRVAAGSAQLASAVGQVAVGAPALVSAQDRALTALQAAAAAHPDDADLQQAVAAAVDTGQRSAAVLQSVVAQSGSAQRLAAGASSVAAGSTRLAGAAPDLARGASSLATGAAGVASGAHRAADGAATLATGTRQLATGAGQVASGSRQLASGSSRLAGGTGDLASGAATLRQRLSSGAAGIPALDGGARDRLSGVVASPVALSTTRDHPAGSYGAGFAPYFIGIALWVGGTFAFGVLRPVARRRPGAANHPLRRTLAGYLPLLAVGAVQVAALIGALHYGLGLDPARPLATLAFLGLTAAAFGAVLQLLHARFGPAGRVMAIVLLVLQLTTSGGTYPIETAPAPFRALHPWLPMTYVITGLRRLLAGGELGPVRTACGVLVGITAVALVLTWLTAARGRDVTATVIAAPEDPAPEDPAAAGGTGETADDAAPDDAVPGEPVPATTGRKG